MKKMGIVFDCDSTLSTIEGIDELGRLAGVQKEIEYLTNQAMDGLVPLEQVYEKRLQIIRPNESQIIEIAQLYLQTIVPDVLKTVGALQKKNIQLAIVSGGLFPAIEPLARALNIADLYAVPMNFDSAGNYLSIEPHPLTTAKGKAQIVGEWRQKYDLNQVIMIGDGMSDAEAVSASGADLFVAFTGVIAREKVVARADKVLADYSDLEALLGL